MEALESVKPLRGQPMCLFTTGRPDAIDEENAAKMILMQLLCRSSMPMLSWARGGYRGMFPLPFFFFFFFFPSSVESALFFFFCFTAAAIPYFKNNQAEWIGDEARNTKTRMRDPSTLPKNPYEVDADAGDGGSCV